MVTVKSNGSSLLAWIQGKMIDTLELLPCPHERDDARRMIALIEHLQKRVQSKLEGSRERRKAVREALRRVEGAVIGYDGVRRQRFTQQKKVHQDHRRRPSVAVLGLMIEELKTKRTDKKAAPRKDEVKPLPVAASPCATCSKRSAACDGATTCPADSGLLVLGTVVKLVQAAKPNGTMRLKKSEAPTPTSRPDPRLLLPLAEMDDDGGSEEDRDTYLRDTFPELYDPQHPLNVAYAATNGEA